MISAFQGKRAMGRWYCSKKSTAEASCDLSIFKLNKLGLLSGKQSTATTWQHNQTGERTVVFLTADVTGDPYVQLTYTLGNTHEYDYQVSLLTSPCSLGGIRFWFQCPECLERVGVIFLPPGCSHFGCRHCNNLTYRSRNRCVVESWGHTSRQIDRLRGEIKRWTWRGRPTRKVRRLHALERKMGVFEPVMSSRLEKLRSCIGR